MVCDNKLNLRLTEKRAGVRLSILRELEEGRVQCHTIDKSDREEE